MWCSGPPYYLLRVVAMLSFSVIIFYSAIEIGPYSLYRKKVISAFKLNKKIVRSQYSFPRKKQWLVSPKPSHLEKASILYMLCICTCSWVSTNDAKIMRSTDAHTLVPEGFFDFSSFCEVANTSHEVERKKNLWLPWTWISLSWKSQGQDLTLRLGLVDIFTNTQINMIGSFDW